MNIIKICLLSVLLNTCFLGIANAALIRLEVVNHWDDVVTVKEGTINPVSQRVAPEGYYNHVAVFAITQFRAYYTTRSGAEVLIPNCTMNSSRSLKVTISASKRSPLQPQCAFSYSM